MALTQHVEHHFTAARSVRDVVIGMSDGLTVPFALAAGLTGAIASSRLIITAGFAEIAAGSIAMGLGGYLAARSEAEHYSSELERERLEVVEKPEVEKREVLEVFTAFGLTSDEATPVVEALSQRPEAWIDFMMRFELGLEKPDPQRAWQSALTIAAAYIAGGLIPLLPYMFVPRAAAALPTSAVVTLAALSIFGFVKGRFTGVSPGKSALQTAIIGGLAATAAFLIARAVT